ncbi:hypothetical protein CKAH01_15438 [Colletotrichum kahawae]|uniref:ToxB-like N-terminal ascomycota domain-containing protein n=1 Tax=Colletotrichum kahawae TaxID=34407 RepID=A0AAD9YIV5_COLKA|nr:hypothetical protein CKAH01_15438 [Colletotrichum kahawae]
MRFTQFAASATVFAGLVFARQDACQIELLNVNQAVVDTACIPFDTTTPMKDPTGPVGGQLYQVHVNNICGVGLDNGQELSNGASLRKVGLCFPYSACSNQRAVSTSPERCHSFEIWYSKLEVNLEDTMSVVTATDYPARLASQRRPGRAAPVYGKTLAGKILWLPRKDELSPAADTDLKPGVYNHPVLILSHEPREDGTVRALTMTSVGGRNITESMAFHWTRRHLYLPIAPTPPHPGSDLQLHLSGDSPKPSVGRPSYVNIRQGPYTIHLGALRSRPGTSLSAKSFSIVTTAMGYTEESDEAKEKIRKERKRKREERRVEKVNTRVTTGKPEVVEAKGHRGHVWTWARVLLALFFLALLTQYLYSRFIRG